MPCSPSDDACDQCGRASFPRSNERLCHSSWKRQLACSSPVSYIRLSPLGVALVAAAAIVICSLWNYDVDADGILLEWKCQHVNGETVLLAISGRRMNITAQKLFLVTSRCEIRLVFLQINIRMLSITSHLKFWGEWELYCYIIGKIKNKDSLIYRHNCRIFRLSGAIDARQGRRTA